MSATTVLDILCATAFGAALIATLRLPPHQVDRSTKLFLATALGVYLFVGLANASEHLGFSAFPRRFEEYAEILFLPFLVFALYSLDSKSELDRRIAAEEELLLSRERYRTLVENVDLGISLVDRDFSILMVNKAQARMIGRPAEEIVGTKCYRLFERAAAPCEGCPGAVAMETAKPARLDRDGSRPDRTPLSLRIVAFPVPGPRGPPESFIEVVEDRTERKRAEIQKHRVEARVLENRRLESLVALAGGVAHDFNNLLMSVLGNAEMALMKMPAGSPLYAYCKRIETAALRASELTRQMTAYSGKTGAVLEPLNLTALVSEASPLVTAAASPKALVSFQLVQGIPKVQGDEDLLGQVLMILALNASEALGDQPGTIWVRTGALDANRELLSRVRAGQELSPGTYAFLEVEDSGGGIPPSSLENLFDPFFSTKAAGRGLGLPAALGILEAHRGGIEVVNQPDRGARFRVLIPADSEGKKDPAPFTEFSTYGRGRRFALVLDEEATVRTVTRMTLEEFGFATLATADELEGLEFARAHAPELAVAVLDVGTARADGPLMQELRTSLGETTALLSVSRREFAEADQLMMQGFGGRIEKPYTPHELLYRISGALETGAARNRGQARICVDAQPGTTPDD